MFNGVGSPCPGSSELPDFWPADDGKASGYDSRFSGLFNRLRVGRESEAWQKLNDNLALLLTIEKIHK